ncbi:GNAT family N-acetyltransferase [Hyphomicrobium sp. ghe19]|uniref:GNAT family N-acetyltransferase n=1 Tax=Hyphomicrobium sp. ghe19 TaxID=2682968 RepID=UPI0013668590|nr:Putative ribosomal N-acetyltransferase YdaF [Hyphomicrobium sp. ghe19]
MAFLRSIRPDEDFETVQGPALTLRQPAASDYAEWSALRAASRAHLTPWEPTWAQDDLSRTMYRRRLRAYAKDVHNDISYPYFIFENATGALIGGVTLSNVRRGSAQTASLGYWMGENYAGRGHMREAVGMILPMAFNVLRLHRIEAAIMLTNYASMRVLEFAGFQREGLARAYLKINGRWEDHLLYARLAVGPVPGGPERGR